MVGPPALCTWVNEEDGWFFLVYSTSASSTTHNPESYNAKELASPLIIFKIRFVFLFGPLSLA